MQVHTYLSFQGDCEAAFAFYQQCLGGTPGPLFRYAGSPLAHTVGDEWQDKIMHASLTIGGQTLMGADFAQGYEAPQGFSLSLHMKDTDEAERIFRELARDGHVQVPMQKTFWAERFGTVVDR